MDGNKKQRMPRSSSAASLHATLTREMSHKVAPCSGFLHVMASGLCQHVLACHCFVILIRRA